MKKDNSNFRTITLMYNGSVRPKNKCIYIPAPAMTNKNILYYISYQRNWKPAFL